MIRAIIFDHNGTLLDDLPVAYGSIREIFRRYNLPCPTPEQYRLEIGTNFMEFYYNHGFPRTTTAKELNVVRMEYYLDHFHEAKLRPEVETVLSALSLLEIKFAIVSADVDSLVIKKLEEVDMKSFFNVIRAGVRDKRTALLEVCKELGVEPHEACYVDDTVDGNTAAKEAGLHAIAIIGTGYHSVERLSKVSPHVISNLYELSAIIEAIDVEDELSDWGMS